MSGSSLSLSVAGAARSLARSSLIGRLGLLAVVTGVILSLALGPVAPTQAGQRAATPVAPTPTPASASASVRCDIPLQTEVAPAGEATPEASPAATPLALGAGQESELQTAETDLNQLARTLAVCLSDEEYETAARLLTPVYRGLLVGTGEELDRETFVEVAQSLTATPLTIRSVSDVTLERDNRATAEVVSVVANELVRARWTFELVGPDTRRPRNADDEAEPNRRWVVAEEEALPVEAPAGAEPVEVTLVEYAIELDPAEVPAGTVRLTVQNDGSLEHEVVVLRLEGDATAAALIYQAGPALPEGITFAGQINVAAGEEETLVLVDLEPGSYALADLSPDAEGVVNISRGMLTTLRVEKA